MAVNAHMADTAADDEQSERFQMRVSRRLLQSIDEWRRRQPDLPNRSEAIRRLIEQALQAPMAR